MCASWFYSASKLITAAVNVMRFAALANAVIDQLEPVQHDDVLDDQQVWLKFYRLTQ